MVSITRADVASLIEEEYNHTLLNYATESSTALRAFRTVQMGAKVQNLPVLSALPSAKWVGTAAGQRTKPTSKFSFDNKVLTAEELAVIVVINEEDLVDATEDLLEYAARLGGQAIGRKLDEAIFFGIDKPASWTSKDLFAAATEGGNVFQVGTGANDLVGSIFKAASAVDASGANPDAFLARGGFKYQLANLRDGQGSPIYLPSLSQTPGGVDNVAGLDAYWNKNGAWDSSKALGMVVDPSLAIVGIRSDISVKFLDQATVDGKNLAEDDQVALRFRARYGYVLADIAGNDGEKVAPVAAVTPAAEAGAAA